MTGIPSSSLDHSIAIINKSANRIVFEIGDRVNSLDIHHDVMVAIAIIISIPKSGKLHNIMEPKGFFKVIRGGCCWKMSSYGTQQR